MFTTKSIIVAAVAAIAIMPAQAAIMSVSGDVEIIVRPADATLNTLTNREMIRVWNEAQDVELESNLTTNARLPGSYPGEMNPVTGIIEAGTRVSSHYIHFDVPTPGGGNATGSVTFDGDILGVILVNSRRNRHLDQSDFLGLGTLFTAGENARGPEERDSVTISEDLRTVTLDFSASNPGDFVRVITSPVVVPEPSAMAALALAGTGLLRRRRA